MRLISVYCQKYWRFHLKLLGEPAPDDSAASIDADDIVWLIALGVLGHSLHRTRYIDDREIVLFDILLRIVNSDNEGMAPEPGVCATSGDGDGAHSRDEPYEFRQWAVLCAAMMGKCENRSR